VACVEEWESELDEELEKEDYDLGVLGVELFGWEGGCETLKRNWKLGRCVEMFGYCSSVEFGMDNYMLVSYEQAVNCNLHMEDGVAYNMENEK
jgi:hypothetical protein